MPEPTCGLYMDLQPDAAPPAPGDWVATPAGSRYLVDTVRRVVPRRHRQLVRYQLRCTRMPRHAEPDTDGMVFWLRWYPR